MTIESFTYMIFVVEGGLGKIRRRRRTIALNKGMMMHRSTVLLAASLVGLAAGRTLIFNAEDCNTNFDDGDNWYNPTITETELPAGQ